MKIEYCGHSCFKVTDGDLSILFDPFADIGYNLKTITADYCVCSHKHFDHFGVQAVNCKAVITSENAAEYPFLKAIDSFHDECKGKKRGENTIFIFTAADGTTFCHMGDIGEPIADFIKSHALTADILAIPVGGNYTIDSIEAVLYCEYIKPKLIIPMHYKTARSNIYIDKKASFLSRMPVGKTVKTDNSLTVNFSDLEKGGKFYGKIIDFNDNNF